MIKDERDIYKGRICTFQWWKSDIWNRYILAAFGESNLVDMFSGVVVYQKEKLQLTAAFHR